MASGRAIQHTMRGHDLGSCIISKPCVEHDLGSCKIMKMRRSAAHNMLSKSMRGPCLGQCFHPISGSGDAWQRMQLADQFKELREVQSSPCTGPASCLGQRRRIQSARSGVERAAPMQGSSMLPWAVPQNTERWIEMVRREWSFHDTSLESHHKPS